MSAACPSSAPATRVEGAEDGIDGLRKPRAGSRPLTENLLNKLKRGVPA
jgi:hypothetical protein